MVKKIMWDKGHRNTTYDFGAVSNGLREADLVNKIVNYAMAYMNSYYIGFEQRCTRLDNQVLALTQRDDEANRWGADVFVSVHISAGGGNGYESYIYNKLSGNSLSIATNLQNCMNDEILKAMQKFGDIRAHGGNAARQKDLHVLRETNMTAILTENLYIDSSDSNYLKNESFLKAVGEAHARGVARFLGLAAKPGTNLNVIISSKEENKVDINTLPLSDWAKGDWEKAIAKGYFDGSRPQDNITRQEASVVANRIDKFNPSNQTMKDAISIILLRLSDKDVHGEKAISTVWRDKFNAGEMTISDGLALLFTAMYRGIFDKVDGQE